PPPTNIYTLSLHDALPISNNIANANTPGYKADQATLRAFPELLIQQMGSKSIPTKNGFNLPISQPIGTLNTGAYVHEMIPNYSRSEEHTSELQSRFDLVCR